MHSVPDVHIVSRPPEPFEAAMVVVLDSVAELTLVVSLLVPDEAPGELDAGITLSEEVDDPDASPPSDASTPPSVAVTVDEPLVADVVDDVDDVDDVEARELAAESWRPFPASVLTVPSTVPPPSDALFVSPVAHATPSPNVGRSAAQDARARRSWRARPRRSLIPTPRDDPRAAAPERRGSGSGRTRRVPWPAGRSGAWRPPRLRADRERRS